jgi:hypothetical protein
VPQPHHQLPDLGTALVVPEPGPDAAVRHLKRPALLFNRISVLHLPGFVSFLDHFPVDRHLRCELDWLLEQGIVTPLAGGPLECFADWFHEAAGQFPRVIADATGFASRMSFLQIEIARRGNWIPADSVLLCATPPPFASEDVTHRVDRAGAIHVVFDAFPEPDEDTPWEQILEFRFDPRSAGQVMALRRWLARIAREAVSAAELSEEIEWLMHEYQAHMRLHRMKSAAGAMESILTASAEAVENLAKLRLGALAKSAFALRHRRIQLLEAERQAPGRELAYVIRAREHFGC